MGNQATVPTLCELVRAHKPDVIFLSETLASSARLEEVHVMLNFANCFSVNCIGRSGGLAFLSNNKVACSLLSYSQNHIDMGVSVGSSRSRITGYYGHLERHRRHLSWNLLKHLSCVHSLSWSIIGDFNDILHNNEKRGRVLHPLHLLRGFRDAVNSCGIWDVELTGYPFTWSRGRGSSNFVEERLDRVMGNALWHEMFPSASLSSLVAPTSDHCPILLDMAPIVVCRRFKSFRFENKWLEERDLPKVVRRSWQGFRDFEVDKRLLATSETMDVWGNHVHYAFKNNKKDLESIIKSLQVAVDVEMVAHEAVLTTYFMLSILEQLDGEKAVEFAMIVWRLWKDRNCRVRAGGTTAPRITVGLARKYWSEWDVSRGSLGPSQSIRSSCGCGIGLPWVS
ncbi:hypothetical protein ACS0TY_016165 [Phlomoides rotata]